MMKNVKVLLENVVDITAHIFLPNRCMFCRTPLEYNKSICDKCAENAVFAEHGVEIIPQEGYGFDLIISPFYYEMGIDTAIADLKFNNNRINAKKLAAYMIDELKKYVNIVDIDSVVAVPMHKADIGKRGYNQSELICEWIEKYTNINVEHSLLKKVRKTEKQHDLSADERKVNLSGAFMASKRIDGNTILLIDDVCTTGSTLNECSIKLKEAGAERIICLTAAKTRIKIKSM